MDMRNQIIINSSQRGIEYLNDLLDRSIQEFYEQNQMLVIMYRNKEGDIKIKLRQKKEAITSAKKKGNRLIGLYLLGQEVTDLI